MDGMFVGSILLNNVEQTQRLRRDVRESGNGHYSTEAIDIDEGLVSKIIHWIAGLFDRS